MADPLAGDRARRGGNSLDAVTAFGSAGTRPSTSLGRQALADAGASYGTGFATVMIIAGGLSLLVGTVGFLRLRRHERTRPRADVRHPGASTADPASRAPVV